MREKQPVYYDVTVKLILIGLVVAFLLFAREFLIPLIIAIFFTFLLLPVSRKLEGWHVPRPLAIIISIFFAVLFFGGLIWFFYFQIVNFTGDLPGLKEKMTEKLAYINQNVLSRFNMNITPDSIIQSVKSKGTSGSGGKLIMGVFSATGVFIANLVLIPIYIFFLTLFRAKFMHFIKMTAPVERHDKITEVIGLVSQVSQKYLKGLLIDVLILSVLNSTGFLLLGLPHAILFGVLAAVLNVIPYIGVLIGSILPVLMALLTKDEIGYALGALGVCFVVQFIDNNFITPLVVGSSVSINPLTAILALVMSSIIWGIPGMVLCMPITGMLKVVCDHVEELKPYGYLIGEERDLKRHRFRKNLMRRNRA